MDAKRATAKHNLLGSSPIVEVGSVQRAPIIFNLELLFEMQVAPVYVKPDTAAIHERIGFDPKPKLQWKKNKDTLWVEDFLSLSRNLLVAMMWLKWCFGDSCSTLSI